MRILATREFSTSRELSTTYIVKIDISYNDTIRATFTINESQNGLFLEKMQVLNPGIELCTMQTTVQDGSAKYSWRTDNHTLITTINGLKEASLISVEFADEICQEFSNLIQNREGIREESLGRYLGHHWPDIPLILQDLAHASVPPPEQFNYRAPSRNLLRFFSPNREPIHSSMWPFYDPARYGSDVPRSSDREPPRAGVFSQKIDELIVKEVISDKDIPDEVRCMINTHVMSDPVYFKNLPQYIYDRPVIEHWLLNHTTDPFTRTNVEKNDLVPAIELKKKIEFFVEQAELKANKKDNKFEEAKAQFPSSSTSLQPRK